MLLWFASWCFNVVQFATQPQLEYTSAGLAACNPHPKHQQEVLKIIVYGGATRAGRQRERAYVLYAHSYARPLNFPGVGYEVRLPPRAGIARYRNATRRMSQPPARCGLAPCVPWIRMCAFGAHTGFRQRNGKLSLPVRPGTHLPEGIMRRTCSTVTCMVLGLARREVFATTEAHAHYRQRLKQRGIHTDTH